MRFQKYAFSSIDSRPHYHFDVFSTVRHTKTLVELYAPATNTPACDISGHRFRFDAFSTIFDRPF